MTFSWYYNRETGDIAHLSKWYTTWNGIYLSARFIKGADFNEQEKTRKDGRFLYECYIAFPNTRSKKLLALDVNQHVLGGSYVHGSYAECREWLENTAQDLVSTIFANALDVGLG